MVGDDLASIVEASLGGGPLMFEKLAEQLTIVFKKAMSENMIIGQLILEFLPYSLTRLSISTRKKKTINYRNAMKRECKEALFSFIKFYNLNLVILLETYLQEERNSIFLKQLD